MNAKPPIDDAAASSTGDVDNEMTDASSIFILKTTPGSLRTVETYLRNRKWDVGGGTQMREVLAYIIQKKPKLVMIPSDHPNKKVKILPKLLTQAFPVKIIGYCESSSTLAVSGLRDMNLPYTIYPPVSGPQVERLWLKMLKDEEAGPLEKQRIEASSGEGGAFSDSPDGGVIRLKGASHAPEQAQQSFESARAALQQLINSKDDDENAGPNLTQQGNAPLKDDPYTNKGTAAPKGPAYMGGAGTESKMHSATQEGPAEGESFAEWEERMRKQLTYKTGEAEGTAAAPSHHNPQTSNEEDEDYDTGIRARSTQKAPIMESEYIGKNRKKTLFVRGEARDSHDDESIVIKGTVEALDSTVVRDSNVAEDNDENVTKIEKASNAACITVDSPRFSGYLVAVLGHNRKIDKAFIDTIKQRLYAFLKANGESVSDDDAQGVKLKEVEFEDWALEQAEFLKKSVHGSEEIAMAFFPNKEIAARLEDSASEKMVQMSIDELKEDVALEFDLYMYMPENNKYLLYTPQGMPLYGKQKGRLTEKGVTHMHLRKDSIADVKKYRAQNFLNDKIEAFKAAKKMKQP